MTQESLMNNSQYVVIAFEEDGGEETVEIVNQNWLDKWSKTFKWPNLPAWQVTKAVQGTLKKEHIDWSTYSYKSILAESSNYEEARKRLRKATLSISLEDTDYERGRDKRRKKNLYSDSSDTSEAETIENRQDGSSLNNPLTCATSLMLTSTEGMGNIDHPQSSLTTLGPPVHETLDQLNSSGCYSNGNLMSPQTQSPSLVSSPTSVPNLYSDNSLEKPIIIVDLFKVILKELKSIKGNQDDFGRQLQAVQGGLCGIGKSVTAPQIPINLPLKTEADFRRLEDWVNCSEENFNLLVHHFRLVGGDDVKDCSRRLLRSLLSPELEKITGPMRTGRSQKSEFLKNYLGIFNALMVGVQTNQRSVNAPQREIEIVISKYLNDSKKRTESNRAMSSYWTKRRKIQKEVDNLVTELVNKEERRTDNDSPTSTHVEVASPSEEVCYQKHYPAPPSPIIPLPEIPSPVLVKDCSLSLKSKLIEWYYNSNISLRDFSKLLSTIAPFHPELCVDARTLLGNIRQVNVTEKCGGLYAHFGLRIGISDKVLKGLMPSKLSASVIPFLNNFKDSFPNLITLSINIDGLPCAKSSNKVLWPILACVNEAVDDNPFIVGIFEGLTKPNDVNEFLRPLVDELNSLYRNLIVIEGKAFNVRILNFVCDAPARAFLKGVKGHNSIHGCERCNTHGVFIRPGVMAFYNKGENREDHLFKQPIVSQTNNTLHRKSSTPLTLMKVLPITQVVLDPMHLIYLGVMRVLIKIWVRVKSKGFSKQCAMSPVNVIQASKNMLSYRKYLPRQFSRRPRCLEEISNWKASELRTFALYLSPVILSLALSKEIYQHFLLFFVAVRILSQPRIASSSSWLDYASNCLFQFVQKAKTIYGDHFFSYNVHSLYHIADDVRQFGPLDYFSAFKYENYMQEIKKMSRGPNKTLQQVVKRVAEKKENDKNKATTQIFTSKVKLGKRKEIGLLPDSFPYRTGRHYREATIFTPECYFNVEHTDNCVILSDNSIVVIKNIYSYEETNYVIGQKFIHQNSLFTFPCDSKTLSIFKLKSLGPIQAFDFGEILGKSVLLPLEEQCFASIPLLRI